MKNANQVVEIINRSQQHMPTLLSLLAGLVFLKKESSLFRDGDRAIGDNTPVTLIDGMNAQAGIRRF